MNDLAVQMADENTTLPALLDRAAIALASAKTSGEVLEAKQMAQVAYDAAKSAGRVAKAKKAHDEVIGAVYRAQADAALIEARAKMRLADEYDAAQERGEVAKSGQYARANVLDANVCPPSAKDLGLSRYEIHEARQLRDAEIAEPGVIERTVNERVEQGQEPTKAAIRAVAKKKPASRKRDVLKILEPIEALANTDMVAMGFIKALTQKDSERLEESLYRARLLINQIHEAYYDDEPETRA